MKCSKTCGTGHQLRAIVCRRTELHNCDEADKPIARQLCHTETPCIGQKGQHSPDQINMLMRILNISNKLNAIYGYDMNNYIYNCV